MLVLLMYTLLSIFGARFSNSVPKKGKGSLPFDFHGKLEGKMGRVKGI